MSTQAKTHPGPAWLWGTAWSIQGLAILAVDFLELQDRTASFVVSGVLAGLPLIGLYVLLLRRGRSAVASNGGSQTTGKTIQGE